MININFAIAMSISYEKTFTAEACNCLISNQIPYKKIIHTQSRVTYHPEKVKNNMQP